MKATTRDIGFAIRDFLEGEHISHFHELDNDELEEHPNSFHIREIDISDPDNPRFSLSNGQEFVVRVIAK